MTTKKPHDSAPIDSKRLTDDDQDLLLEYGLHPPAEIKSYVKPAGGMERMTPRVAAFLAAHPEIASALKIDPTGMQSALDEATHLDGPTARAYNLYRRGYENAMAKRSEVARAIFKVNRFVQNAGDPELASEIADVAQWIDHTHGHHGAAPAAEDAAPAADDESSTP